MIKYISEDQRDLREMDFDFGLNLAYGLKILTDKLQLFLKILVYNQT